MSGHSRWSKIKHVKGAADAKKGKIYTKLIKEIAVAARMGGGDINGNPRLRKAVDTARQQNMPGDNITRAVKRGTGELEGVTYEEVNYEGFGPGGVAILVEVLTDNKNRTVSEVRKIFEKHNGNMGAAGSVAYMFQDRGLIYVSKSETTEDRLMEVALEAGAEDITDEGDEWSVRTTPSDFDKVKAGIEKAKIAVARAEVSKVPQSTVKIEGRDAENMLKLAEALDDHDDVQRVSANFDIPDSVLERMSA